jgi:hypothetical protein
MLGHDIAQVVSHQLTTAVAQVRAWVKSCGICSTEYFGFPCQAFPHLLHSSSSRAGAIGHLVASVIVDLVLLHYTPRNNKKYMLLSCYQNAVENCDVKTANRLFGHVSQFKYLGTIVTNLNLFQEEIMRRLNSGNACYISIQFSLDYTRLQFCLWSCMGVKLGL